MAESYKIISQSQAQEINPAGTGFMEVWNIAFQVTSGSATGMRGTIQVGNDQHNAADVKKAVEAKVADLSEIASLGG